MAQQRGNWGLWLGIAGAVAGLGGLYLSYSAEQRRRAREREERRCDGWHALPDEQIAGYYDAIVSGSASDKSPEFFACVAIELEERGYAGEAQEIWAHIVERQIETEPGPPVLPTEADRCADFTELSDDEVRGHYQSTLSAPPGTMGQDFLACLVTELHVRGMANEARELSGRMQAT